MLLRLTMLVRLLMVRFFDQRDGATMPVGGVIPGFTEALTKMPVGAKWEITIPYTAGYGAEQPSPRPQAILNTYLYC